MKSYKAILAIVAVSFLLGVAIVPLLSVPAQAGPNCNFSCGATNICDNEPGCPIGQRHALFYYPPVGSPCSAEPTCQNGQGCVNWNWCVI